MKNAVNAFKEELAKVLEISIEKLENIKNLNHFVNWDSLAIVSTMAMIAQYFDVHVNGKQVESCQTFNDLLVLAKPVIKI
jgi:acyl carrier protein